MYRDGDPGSVPLDHTRILINCNIRNGEIQARGGQSVFTVDPLDGCVRLLYDFQTGNGPKIYASADGCSGVSAGAGFSLENYDQEQEPQFQRVIYYDTAVTNLVMGIFDGSLWLGLDDTLLRYVWLRPQYGREAQVLSGESQDRPTKVFTGFSINALQQFDGDFYVFLAAGAGTSKTVNFDGVSILDDDTATQIPTGAGLYRDLLIVGYATTVGKIRYRTKGAVPGTWTDVVAAGAGFAQGSKGLSYKDKFYMADGGTNVWVYNGTTLTASLTIGGTTITDLEVANGYLYAIYTNGVNGRIARFDGTTWTNIHKDLTAQVGAINSARRLAWYKGDLYAYVTTSTPGTLWYRSPGSNTSGTWTAVPLGNLSGTNDINQMLVYP
jgi:hypothetical protein